MMEGMLNRTNDTDPPRPALRKWAVAMLIFLIAGMAYLVLREAPRNTPPVPSPNFNSVDNI